MTGNKKADRFKGRQIKATAQQSNRNEAAIAQLQKLMQSLVMTMIQQDKEIRDLKEQASALIGKARSSDFRSVAIMQLLDASQPVTKAAVVERVSDLYIEEFNEGSAIHDKDNGLEEVVQGPAEPGMFAIIKAKLFKNGAEQEDERVLRAKIEIGKEEMFPGLDAALSGLFTGQRSQGTFETGYGPREVEVTLLGLRKKATATEATEETQAQA
jgi:hypothetical protein